MGKLYSTLRKEDERLSDNVSSLLDSLFYQDETLNISEFKRIYDKATQVQGIDTEFLYNKFDYLCDEKSAVRYKNLNTFALELSFKNRNNTPQIGWLLNENLKNNSYLFTWLNEDKYGNKEIETALLKKKTIMDYLADELKWTKENLQKKSDRIRYYNDRNFGTISENKCTFRISEQLVEQPVNILLPKKTYIELADIHKAYKISDKT